MKMYYLALVAPEEINSQVLIWKSRMKDLYGSVIALRSPAHITLIPPFWMEDELEENLIAEIDIFSKQENSFSLMLNGFSCFETSVIFIDLLPNEKLQKLKLDLESFLISRKLLPIKKDDRIFHPHITIATRDLYKKDFTEAWTYFENKKYTASWKAKGISVLRHNKKNWDVIYTSQFINI